MNPVNAEAASCIYCGQRLGDAPDAASFLFLAKRQGSFTSQPASWLDQSTDLEGHQFFCHAECFRSSVPEAQQEILRFALEDE